LDKESKENKKMPEDPVEEPTGEEKIQDKAEEAVEDKQEEKTDEDPVEETNPEAPEEESEEPLEEKAEEPVEETEEEKTEEIKEPVEEETPEVKEPSEEKPVEEKKEKPAEAKEKAGKKDRDPDFKYIVRISNTDVDGDKKVVYGLKSIKGIGINMATLIADEAGIDRNIKIGDLKDADIEKLQSAINKVIETAPHWMLNHRKDYDTGEDIHLIGPEIDMRLRDEINIMKKIRSYRGIRHERGLPVRGQRTRANNRKGLALGVSKKRDQ
jgi:small subunit ribosomal protein S13